MCMPSLSSRLLQATVNLLKEEALVKFDMSAGSIKDVLGAVDDVGFEASVR